MGQVARGSRQVGEAGTEGGGGYGGRSPNVRVVGPFVRCRAVPAEKFLNNFQEAPLATNCEGDSPVSPGGYPSGYLERPCQARSTGRPLGCLLLSLGIEPRTC